MKLNEEEKEKLMRKKYSCRENMHEQWEKTLLENKKK